MRKKPLSIDALEKIIKDLEQSKGVLVGNIDLDDFLMLLSKDSDLNHLSADDMKRIENLSLRLNKIIKNTEDELIELKDKVSQTRKSTKAHSSYINASTLGNDNKKDY